jgi:hypothetical protein
MDGVYVSKLFDLLKVLHVEQAEVVKELRVHKGQVSRWAKGKRVLPGRYTPAFTRFVEAKLVAALAQAKANDRPPGGTTVLTGAGRSTAQVFEWEVRGLLAGWELELSEQMGQLGEAARNNMGSIGSYATQDLAKLSTQERRQLYDTVKRLEKYLRYSSFLHDDAPERLLKRPIGRDDLDPLEYFRRLVVWALVGERSHVAGDDHEA